ncbi:glycosyltransferase [Elusimicrobiota bacterium]
MKFSIIIPAHNEEAYIGKCLDSIDRASVSFPEDVEIIVVINRCDDTTEDIAIARGARIVHEDAKNLAIIRNAGAKIASADIIVTIDADSLMSQETLTRIDCALKSGKYIGGGAYIRPERYSLGIWTTLIILRIILLLTGLTGGLYWCRKRDFDAVGGFNEKVIMGEDLEFASRLKQYGKKKGLKFITLPKAVITTSMRKFDKFGDWYFLKTMLFNTGKIKKLMRGEYLDEHFRFADEFFYEFSKDSNEETNKEKNLKQ